MLKIKKPQLRKIKGILEKIPIRAGENVLATFLILFSISLLLGVLTYWRFYLASTEEKEIAPTQQLKFRSQTYQEVLDLWEQKGERLQKTDSARYPDLFAP